MFEEGEELDTNRYEKIVDFEDSPLPEIAIKGYLFGKPLSLPELKEAITDVIDIIKKDAEHYQNMAIGRKRSSESYEEILKKLS